MAKNEKITVQTTSQNKQIIYRFLHRNGSSTKQDLLVGTGLSLPTITQGLKNLAAEGLIAPSESIRQTGGRSAIAYDTVPNANYAIGLFFSAHHITAASVDMKGTIFQMKRERRKADLHNEAYLSHLGELVEELKRESGLPQEALLGVGIAVQSLVSEDGEMIEFGMTQDFSGITRSTFARYLRDEVRLFHDSAVAGYAEVWSRPELRDAFYLSLNNVVGGAFIFGSRTLFSGDNHRAGEIGHTIVDAEHGELCYCGQRGCFDTVCRSTVLDSYTDGNLEAFFKLLREGDAEARKRFDRYLSYLSIAIHNIRMLFDCPVIVGGYVGSYMEPYMEDLYRLIDKRMIFGSPARTYVFPCRYKQEVMAAGAAIQLIEERIRNV